MSEPEWKARAQLPMSLPVAWTHAPKKPTETDMAHEVSPHYDAAGRWVCNTCREEVKLG